MQCQKEIFWSILLQNISEFQTLNRENLCIPSVGWETISLSEEVAADEGLIPPKDTQELSEMEDKVCCASDCGTEISFSWTQMKLKLSNSQVSEPAMRIIADMS